MVGRGVSAITSASVGLVSFNFTFHFLIFFFEGSYALLILPLPIHPVLLSFPPLPLHIFKNSLESLELEMGVHLGRAAVLGTCGAQIFNFILLVASVRISGDSRDRLVNTIEDQAATAITTTTLPRFSPEHSFWKGLKYIIIY